MELARRREAPGAGRAGQAPERLCGGGLMSALHEQLASDGLLQIDATTAHAQLDTLAQQATSASTTIKPRSSSK